MCEQKEENNYCWSSLKEICSVKFTFYCWAEHRRVGHLVSGYAVTMLPTLHKQPAAKNALMKCTENALGSFFRMEAVTVN
jgi:hypothetical protein